MRLLVFGSNGQVGQCLRDQLKNSVHDVEFCGHEQLDIADSFSTEKKIFLFEPDIVINVAAYTKVDKSECEEEVALEINCNAVRSIATSCKIIDAVLVHLSTDYVFDGKSNTPYTENSPVCPLGVYGKSKLLGEEAIIKSQCRHIIIRTSWLFSMYGNNFLKTMLRLGTSKDLINVVNDEIGRPTYAPDLAKGILAMCRFILTKDFHSGIYNFAGQSVCSWYDFSLKIFKHAKSKGLSVPDKVLPIKSSDYETLAQRPNYSVLDNTKFLNQFGQVGMELDEAIEHTLTELKSEGLL